MHFFHKCLVNFKELIPNNFSHYCIAFRVSLKLTYVRTDKTHLGLSYITIVGSQAVFS